MATTRTASSQFAAPRASHEGLTVAKATITVAGTVSASEVILAIKIPHGATVLDGYISGMCNEGAHVWKVGTAADDDFAGALLTLSATAQMKRFDGGSMPFKVSLSDDANPQWTWLKLEKVSGSATTTASIQVVVNYAMPGAV